ncbi:MAG: sigma-70 family RNA polymerase sigma factor [Bacteroidetes Order II. Incertae sedis bacterium]|nr:sigma-70 family RNA polymerase sigma factor [Bacteroidetes Order II. bacterium]
MINPFPPELIEQAKTGNQTANNLIFSRLRPLLHGYFVRQIGMKDHVEDLVQNTLVRVHRSLPDLQQADRFKAFAMKAALFELQDLYRGRYGIREMVFDPEEMPDRATMPEDVGLQMDLQKVLEELTPKARQIIELKQLGYPYEEIAQILGTTEAAIKMQVKRAFDRLRVLLTQTLGVFLLLFLPN